MEQNSFINRLNELIAQENIIAIGREVNELRIEFEDYLLEITRKFQVAQLEAEDRGEEFNKTLEIQPIKDEFYSIYNAFKDKRKALIEEKKAVESENLRQKRSLIHALEELIQKEENIGAAFSSQKEINEKWKSIGPIPRDKRQEIQQEYSRLLEEFFYNIKIYKEIKAYDYKKNLELKESVILRLKALMNEENIKTLESQLKSLQDEWEDIGPTEQDAWEKLKEEYWNAVKSAYDKIRAHYDQLREQQKQNISKKEDLLRKVEEILSHDRDSIKTWNRDTKLILAVQEEWKNIGFGPRKENEQVWKKFRSLCDSFFASKSEFFTSIQSKFDDVAKQKEALIEKAEALKDSQDWKETTTAIIQLQKNWKKLGNAGQRNENRLWKAFRAPIDHFFEAKDQYFKALDKQNEVNLEKKEAFIKEIEAFQLPENTSEALKALKEFAQQFSAIGHVPIKQKDAIYQKFKQALDHHYASLKLEGKEKEKALFQAKLETIKASPNADNLIEKEKVAIRKKMDEIKQSIIQYENNLGFFSNSKGANSMKEEVERKIQKEKALFDELKLKLQTIRNE